MPRVHAVTDDALGEDDLVGLLGRLQRRDVSPAELVDAAVERVERVEPELSAVAHAAYDEARAQARGDLTGPFAGVPTYLKDNVDLRGMPTQHGSRAWVAGPAEADGDWARLHRATGMVALGKSRLSEFGFSPSAEPPGGPPVRNPWDTGRTSGASSAGSAALVAAGVVPLAHGNDGGGSIRIPADCCGLVGLKPTRGRTPSDKRNRDMPVRIVADGVLTRSVRDSALFLREAEKTYRDLRLPPVGDIRRPGRKRLVVGLVVQSIGDRRTDPETLAVVNATARLLEGAGHYVEPIDAPAPPSFEEDFTTYWAMLAAVLHDGGRLLLDRDFDKHATDPLTQGLARLLHRRAYRLPQAITRLRRAQRISEDLYARYGYDVVLSPTLLHPARPLGELEPFAPLADFFPRITDWVGFTPWHNATGEPALALPTGATADGNPVGVMISGPQGSEATLLELGYEIEELAPFRRIQDG
ncbi:amidase [Marmoricola endophyticus]|uniref:Amidase n=1 Tax=Marmoricola endophyticus TaxID=2040280 RepID=A0A917F4X6_9ACTN|nr:amidase [Marmoricola endophyticus]GGF43488.1 amidase [Marmoricola endophyticus]